MFKRKRATNFSHSEKELLLKLCLSKKNILESKSSNSVTWKDKEKAWEEIQLEYNSQTLESPRSSNCLRLKYENIKKCMRRTKAAFLVTGGGTSLKTFESPSELEAELFRTIQVSVEGKHCEFDSDAINANNECSWIPLNSVNLLRNNAKNSKLIIDNTSSQNQCEPPTTSENLKETSNCSTLINKRIKTPKTKYCQQSISQKIHELTEDKKHLAVLQEELVKQEIAQSSELHMLKMKHMTIEHDMKVANLKLQNDILMKQLLEK